MIPFSKPVVSTLSNVFESKLINFYIKFTSLTAGRDSIYRFLQYFGRFLQYHLSSHNGSKKLIASLILLQSTLGQARKVMRAGKFIDSFKGGLQVLKNPGDELSKLLVGSSRMALGGYLTLDTLLLLNSLGFINVKNAANLTRTSLKAWFASIFLNWLNSLYQMYALNLQFKTVQRIEKKRSVARLQFFQTSLDMLIPLGLLRSFPISDGIIGAAGSITSIIGGNTLANTLTG
ncbi:hypothetical protein BB559_002236 [Furculomyces boomerangus]|uniref:Peroxisomal membrane protein PMP27 n=1 Tax=Furculomyces boomerangus TaxID=61424 RepID=A0A2T9YWZ6_9FUNG|nr:hypothetical protein BB559_002236 [Furculomyces boomerangus]